MINNLNKVIPPPGFVSHELRKKYKVKIGLKCCSYLCYGDAKDFLFVRTMLKVRKIEGLRQSSCLNKHKCRKKGKK